MMKKTTPTAGYVQPYRYPSPNIPIAAIRRFARRIAERFHPHKIVLFGSYAYGSPHAESDVDLLVIMPCRNAIDQSIRIGEAVDHPFSLDLIVRTPWQVERPLKDGNWFLTEVMEKGKVLYEARDECGGNCALASGCRNDGDQLARTTTIVALSVAPRRFVRLSRRRAASSEE